MINTQVRNTAFSRISGYTITDGLFPYHIYSKNMFGLLDKRSVITCSWEEAYDFVVEESSEHQEEMFIIPDEEWLFYSHNLSSGVDYILKSYDLDKNHKTLSLEWNISN
jgi:hypothetical protein